MRTFGRIDSLIVLPSGTHCLVLFSIMGTLSEFERNLIVERPETKLELHPPHLPKSHSRLL